MIDFMFFVKTFLLTLVVVLAMQVRIGERSVEQHAVSFVQSSAVTMPLNQAAGGAAKLVKDLTQKISNSIHKNVAKKKPEAEDDKKKSTFRWGNEFRKESDSDNNSESEQM